MRVEREREGGGSFLEERGRGEGRRKEQGGFESEFLLLVESSWARGPLEHNELNELQNQLTN